MQDMQLTQIQSAQDFAYTVIHAQKILIGQSNRFCAGYLVIKGEQIEKFIPESTGISSLTEQQKSNIIEVQPYQYVLPGIIDTNVTIHIDSQDQDWIDNKHLTMLALKYGITTFVNQSLHSKLQSNTINESSNIRNELQGKNEQNIVQDSSISKKKDQNKLNNTRTAVAIEQNQNIIKNQQSSQILNEENECKTVEHTQGDENHNQKITNLQNIQKTTYNNQKGDSLYDFQFEDKINQQSWYEPAIDSHVSPSGMELQTKFKQKNKNIQQDNNAFQLLFCDCFNIHIPDKQEILPIQMNRKTATNQNYLEMQTPKQRSELKIQSKSFECSSNQDQQTYFLSPIQKQQHNLTSKNMIKLYTSPPFLPNIYHFTKYEFVAAYIKSIYEQRVKRNIEFQLDFSSSSPGDFSSFLKDHEKSNQFGSQEEDSQEKLFQPNQFKFKLFNFQETQQQAESQNPFETYSQYQANSSQKDNRQENIQKELPKISQKSSSERYLYNNQFQLSIIPEVHSCQTENPHKTHQEITESQIKASNNQFTSGSLSSQIIQAAQNQNLKHNQQSILMQEEGISENQFTKVNQKSDAVQVQTIISLDFIKQQSNQQITDDHYLQNQNQQANLFPLNQAKTLKKYSSIDTDNPNEDQSQQNRFLKSNSQENLQSQKIENTSQENELQYQLEQKIYEENPSNQQPVYNEKGSDLGKDISQNVQEKDLQNQQQSLQDEIKSENDNLIAYTSTQTQMSGNIQKCKKLQKIENERVEESKIQYKNTQQKEQKKQLLQETDPLIFFIHPSSQQGDNNLSLSSPFRQHQFNERLHNRYPPKLGGDALRAPFEKDYDETINYLKTVEYDQEEYNEEMKQILYDVFEASKENSKLYTDHLISHSQLSDYKSDLMDENDQGEPYKFQLKKQALTWPQPQFNLNFDKERYYFNQECNNYSCEKNLQNNQTEVEMEIPYLADSQILVNDEIRESIQNIHKSVIQFEDTETEKMQQLQQQFDTPKDIKEKSSPLKELLDTDKNQLNSQQHKVIMIRMNSDNLYSEQKKDIFSQQQQRKDSRNKMIEDYEEGINKEQSPKDDNEVEQQSKEPQFRFQQQKNISQNNSESKCIKDQLSPINFVQYGKLNLIKFNQFSLLKQDGESSYEGGKNNEPNVKLDNDNLIIWKNSPLFKTSHKQFNIQEKQSPFQEIKADNSARKEQKDKDLNLLDLSLNKRFSGFEGIMGVKKAKSIVENSEDDLDHSSSFSNTNKNISETKAEAQFKQENDYSNNSLSESLDNSIVSIKRLEQKNIIIQPEYQYTKNKIYPNEAISNQFKEEQNIFLQQNQADQEGEACQSQVRRRNFTIQKLETSNQNIASQNLVQSQLEISNRNNLLGNQEVMTQSNKNSLPLENQKGGAFNLPQMQINPNFKGEDSLTKSSLSLFERRQRSQIQSINLDTSKQITQHTQISYNPKIDYLHFLSARPFFWEYYALQLYSQVFRNLLTTSFEASDKFNYSSNLSPSPYFNQPQQNILTLEPDNNKIVSKNQAQSQNQIQQISSAWKERALNTTTNNQARRKQHNNQIATFIFQNISNGLSIVRIFSMKKVYEEIVNIYSEVSWPFLFFDSTQITTGDSRFKSEPAIQNLQNKQILQSSLFNNQKLISMVGSFHFTVPAKYKFFSQNQNLSASQQAQSIHNMTQQADYFPGDFQRAINGLFSLGGQLPSLWTIAVSQNQSNQIQQKSKSPVANRSKSSSFSFGLNAQRIQISLPSNNQNPSIFKQHQGEPIEEKIQGSDDSLNNELNIENEPFAQNMEQITNEPSNEITIFREQRKKSSLNLKEKEDLNMCIKQMIKQKQLDNLTNSENQSPVSSKMDDILDINSPNKQMFQIQEDMISIKSESNHSTPNKRTHNTSRKQLTEQEEKYLVRIADVLSRNPAKICNLKQKGALEEGKHADLIIFDPFKIYDFSAQIDEKQKFPAQLHILNSQKVQGKVVSTFLRGKKIYDNQKFYLDEFNPIFKL